MTAAAPRPSHPQCCALLLQHHCFDDQPPAHSYRRCARQLPPAAAMHYANGARGRGFCNFSTCFTSGKMAAYELSPALLYLHFLVWSRSRGAGDINILRNTFKGNTCSPGVAASCLPAASCACWLAEWGASRCPPSHVFTSPVHAGGGGQGQSC